ncbi:HD family phosphohydrolase [Natranaerofaba carboxydovora]|uniref:HD family phosphohydrolase n=1 Tax=Natranaerofaba carboxydovora TaxID=2742683 RepID=UPI001F138CE2|nr:HDIG domain-containing metalloprotein [Natranaerofaba carboxydovora]UMZ73085.1 Cyclic-di-AMP phosphodiesterase PgpH [Natranaerofaba carboxydovora]
MAVKKKQKRNLLKNLIGSIKLFNNKEMWKKAGIVGLIFVSVILVMSINFFPETFERGQVSPKTIFAHRDVIDVYTTEKLQEEQLEQVSDVYKHDEDVHDIVMERVDAVFGIIIDTVVNGEIVEEADEEEAQNQDEKVEYAVDNINDQPGISNVDEDLVEILLDSNPDRLENMQYDLKPILSNALEQGIKEEDLEEELEDLKNEISVMNYNENEIDFLIWLTFEAIEPNMIFDEEATEEEKQEAIDSVEPVEILEGEVIVREGERITEQQARALEELDLMRADRSILMFVGLILIIAVIFLLLGLFIYYFRKDILENNRLLVLAGLILVALLLLAQGISIFSEFLIPVAMASILYAVLFGAKLSVMFVGMIAILIGILTDFNFEAMIIAMVGGLVGTFSVTRLQERGDLTRAGIYVALINLAVITGLLLVRGGVGFDEKLLKAAYGVTNGFLSGILAIGILPYLESGFGLTTPVRLLELSNPNHPLLRKLMMEAPGTYHHSIIVGNLAEAAAEKVEADTILSRVGAYYHDIGKINRPYFFIENQFSKENPHDKISPSLSSLIIVSHVKEGVELAREYNLPEIIQDMIKQHHGTNFVGYFFYQLQEDNENKNKILEEDFKYKGPKPQTKEAAIVMLADSVEAAVRAMSDPTSHKIEGLVHKIVKKHLDEGQLNECHLTLKDLNEISKSFVQILLGIYHNRVKYPEELVKRSQLNGSYDKGSKQKKTEERGEQDNREDNKDSDRRGEDDRPGGD